MKIKKIFLIIAAILLALSFSYAARWCYLELRERKKEQALFEQRKVSWEGLKKDLAEEIKGFKGTSGVIIKDLATGWEISHNKDRLFPSASLTKVPIMSACFLAASEGALELESGVRLHARDKLPGSGTLKNMKPGSVITVEDLISLMICDSDNTATGILTDIAGIDYLNYSFSEFGLKDTRLYRKIADYNARNKGIENYTSASDMALILEKIYRGSLVDKEVSERCLELLKSQHVRDRIPKYLPDDIIVAHKTGLERTVCHDAGIVFAPKGDFLICVLTEHNNHNSLPSKKFIADVALRAYTRFEEPLKGDAP